MSMKAIDATEKKCKKCLETKPTTLFYKQKQTNDKGGVYHYYDTLCKICRNATSFLRRKSIKKQSVEYLGGSCSQCGIISDHYEIYDFHHTDPSKKDFTISLQSSAYVFKEKIC